MCIRCWQLCRFMVYLYIEVCIGAGALPLCLLWARQSHYTRTCGRTGDGGYAAPFLLCNNGFALNARISVEGTPPSPAIILSAMSTEHREIAYYVWFARHVEHNALSNLTRLEHVRYISQQQKNTCPAKSTLCTPRASSSKQRIRNSGIKPDDSDDWGGRQAVQPASW